MRKWYDHKGFLCVIKKFVIIVNSHLLIKSFAFCLTTDNFVMQEIVTIEINTNEGKNASSAVQQVSKLK